MMLTLLGIFYATMVIAGYLVDLVFEGLGLLPDTRDAKVSEQAVTWNYTTFLNIVFLVLAGVLIWRFLRTGGREMLAMMGGSPDEHARHDHPSPTA
jgi:hypothetical protein